MQDAEANKVKRSSRIRFNGSYYVVHAKPFGVSMEFYYTQKAEEDLQKLGEYDSVEKLDNLYEQIITNVACYRTALVQVATNIAIDKLLKDHGYSDELIVTCRYLDNGVMCKVAQCVYDYIHTCYMFTVYDIIEKLVKASTSAKKAYADELRAFIRNKSMTEIFTAVSAELEDEFPNAPLRNYINEACSFYTTKETEA